MSSTPKPIKKPGFFYIYWCMLLVSGLEVFKYVLSIRAPNENEEKNYGLLAQCILEFAKIIGCTIKITVSLLVSIFLLTVWTPLLPLATLVTAGIVFHRVSTQERESEANTEKLRQEISE